MEWSDRYFESQLDPHCGLHASNSLIGAPQFTHPDLQHASAQIIADTDEPMADHVAPGGWYSHGVLAKVLQNTIFPRWRLRLSPLLEHELLDFFTDPMIYGVLLNENNVHRIALAKHAGHVWHVDSRQPRRLELDELTALLHSFPATHPLLDNEHLSYID